MLILEAQIFPRTTKVQSKVLFNQVPVAVGYYNIAQECSQFIVTRGLPGGLVCRSDARVGKPS